ncbi:MAG: dGTP triphosphohydrolase [Muribaculaceae bacterium]
MMNWDRLICDKRLGLEHYHDKEKSGIRSDFQRDYDRLVFSSPFRRLQNKTQVFPLPGSIFVHNRLTHSLEVSCVGRSLAREIAMQLRDKYAGEPWVGKLDHIDSIVAAACLAHDLGNPPFGHSGEKTIASFFSEGNGQCLQDKLTPEQWCDLTHFEGNANSFRWLVHQFSGRRCGGFAMTYSMLMSIVKYPFSSQHAGAKGKFGFFSSEKEIFCKVADELQMLRIDNDCYHRHPLVYLVEAADDICYQVMDIEDAHRLKIVGTQETIDLFLSFFDKSQHAHLHEVMDKVSDPNEKIGYLRSCIVGCLVMECAQVFVNNEEQILSGSFSGCLIEHISPTPKEGYRRCTELAYTRIYRASDVVDIDLAGNQIITMLLDRHVQAVLHPELNYSQLLLSKVPQQYEVSAPTLFEKLQAVIDHISGMTDVYALDLYRKLNGMSLPAV